MLRYWPSSRIRSCGCMVCSLSEVALFLSAGRPAIGGPSDIPVIIAGKPAIGMAGIMLTGLARILGRMIGISVRAPSRSICVPNSSMNASLPALRGGQAPRKATICACFGGGSTTVPSATVRGGMAKVRRRFSDASVEPGCRGIFVMGSIMVPRTPAAYKVRS